MASTIPIVSVIIPLYNAEHYITETLNSVLTQTYTDFEIILVDDGSNDQSVELCRSSLRTHPDVTIHIISQSNRGLPGARNTGIRHAKGHYLAMLDSDDLWHPRKLEFHVQHLDQSPAVGISFSYSEFINDRSQPIGLYQKSKKLTGITPEDILCRNPVGNGSTAVIRREMLEAIKFQDNQHGSMEDCYFDESFQRAEDLECWMRIAITTEWMIAGIPEVLTYYRITSNGLSANALQQLYGLDRVIEKTRTYAPGVIARCESLARAYHFRYTARRLVTLGESKTALRMLHSSLRSDWRIIRDEPRKTLLTALAVYFMHYLPTKLYHPLQSLAMMAIARPSKTPIPEVNPS
jgi:glycosyltransferase involved in cell wall biosynthesis